MTIEDAQKELDRVTPIWQKHGDYIDELRKIINTPEVVKTIEEFKTDAEGTLTIKEVL